MFRSLYTLSYICSIVVGIYVGFYLGDYTATLLLNNIQDQSIQIVENLLKFLARYWQNPQQSLIFLCSYGSAGLFAKQLIANHSNFYYFLNLRKQQRINQQKTGKANLVINNILVDLLWGSCYIIFQTLIPYICFWLIVIWLFFKLFSLLWYFSIIPAWATANFASIHATNLLNIIFAPGDLEKSLREF
jgi:hypothetical protein